MTALRSNAASHVALLIVLALAACGDDDGGQRPAVSAATMAIGSTSVAVDIGAFSRSGVGIGDNCLTGWTNQIRASVFGFPTLPTVFFRFDDSSPICPAIANHTARAGERADEM